MSENRSLQSATIDDTFNTLRRTPIRELDLEFRQRMWEFYSSPTTFIKWLDKHGWTEDDLFKAGKEYERGRRNL